MLQTTDISNNLPKIEIQCFFNYSTFIFVVLSRTEFSISIKAFANKLDFQETYLHGRI